MPATKEQLHSGHQNRDPDRDNLHLLRTFLAGNDHPCPICQHNLRDYTATRCPECGHRITISINNPTPPLKLWITATLATAIPAGFSATITTTFLIVYAATRGDISPGPAEITAIAHTATAAPALTLLLANRRRFYRAPLQTRLLTTATLAAASLIATTLTVLAFL